jgi:hypothetical protein
MSRRMYRRRAQLEPIGIEEVDEFEMEDDDLEDEIAEIENEIEAMDDEVEAEDEEIAMLYMDDDEEDDEVEAEDMLFMDDDEDDDDGEDDEDDEVEAMLYMDDDEEDEMDACRMSALDIDVPADSMVQDYDEVSEWLGTTTQGEDMVEVLDKEYLVANSGRIKEACKRLDRVASSLEKRGKVDLAYRVDKISDALESQLNK